MIPAASGISAYFAFYAKAWSFLLVKFLVGKLKQHDNFLVTKNAPSNEFSRKINQVLFSKLITRNHTFVLTRLGLPKQRYGGMSNLKQLLEGET